MKKTSKILFDYLSDVFYEPSKASLDVDELDDDFIMLGKGLIYFAHCFAQYNELARALSKGDLSIKLPPPENELAAPLKSLHASLKHLTWQSKQVAMGDYKQQVDFMGEFAEAFNMMIKQLAERQLKLEAEIELSDKKTVALEQSNQLLTNITKSIPQQIVVLDRYTHQILFMNAAAREVIDSDPEYMRDIIGTVSEHSEPGGIYHTEIQHDRKGEERYLAISAYCLEWSNRSADAIIINDVSAEKSQIKELETYAYMDALTNLHNRFFGTLSLNNWLSEKKRFALIFADLDNLKYINDQYGHNEGDKYILCAADFLRTISEDALVCRIGGDEFMLLVPDIGYDEAYAHMTGISQNIQAFGSRQNEDFQYDISFGIAAIEESNKSNSSAILSLADEKMYEQKRMKKKNRQIQKGN